MNVRSLLLFAAIASACIAPLASRGAPAAAAPAQPAPAKLTVAILDFQASTPGTPELGQQIGEVLTATLSGNAAYTLVDRATLSQALSEQHLSQTGVVTADQAVKVAQVVGAKILVTGKVFTLDKQLVVTAKIVGTETSLVEGIVVKGDRDAGLSDLLLQVSAQLAKALPEKGPHLIAGSAASFDPIPALKQKLAGRKLPKVAVRVGERHVAAAHAAGIDPAVETEIRRALVDCGFTVIDGDEKDWAKAGVEVVVSGEAFSEFAAKIGDLVSCSARAEIKAVNYADNVLLVADRETTRAVDVAENLAGKTALEKAGHTLGVRLLEHFADHLPAK